ncbi:MAG: glycosyltransferase [Fibrobacteres bacterium]|nr:glycosyltransferase [Fibrobacterota bacterium]
MPEITVIVCARNEEKTLSSALESLTVQTVPNSDYEVIVVNDASTDRTSEIARNFCSSHEFFRLIDISDADRNGEKLKGKQLCLHKAIAASEGKFIIQLDADCTAANNFIELYLAKFRAGYSFIFGITDIASDNSLLSKFQRADLHYLMTIAHLSAKLGWPLSSMGNNMGYVKSDYYEVGCYETLGANIVEDYQLMLAFKRRGKKIAVLEKCVPVLTKPEESFKAFLLQRIRWASGAFLPNLSMHIMLLARALMSLTVVVALIAILLFENGILLWPAVAVVIVDLSTFLLGAKVTKKRGVTTALPLWLCWFYLSPLVLGVSAFFTSKIRWK